MLKNVLQICAFIGILSIRLSICDDPAKYALSVLQGNVMVGSLKDIEPGFELTAEEVSKFKIWPRGIISYYIDTVSFDKVLRDRIRIFLDSTSGLTGLQFLEMPNPPDDDKTRWVFFLNRRGMLGCADQSMKNFTNEGVQKVLLGYDCVNGGGLAEMVLALVGVPPQHNAPNRDKYITVEENNILLDKRYLYEGLTDRDWLFHDLDYDFASAGHFHLHKHTINGAATINPKTKVDIPIGEANGFSYTDILKIRMLYNYLSAQPYIDAKSPDCKKLFKPGPKLTNYDLPKFNNPRARAKPNKYLGLPDNHKSEEKNEDKNVTKSNEDPNDDSKKDNTKNSKEEQNDETNKSLNKKSNEKQNDEMNKSRDNNSNEKQNDEMNKSRDKNSNEKPNDEGNNKYSNEDQKPKSNAENNEKQHKTKETQNNKKIVLHYQVTRPTPLRNTKKLKKDILSILSDYETDDGKNKKQTRYKKDHFKAVRKSF